jgi:hypothetical protein
VRKTWTEFVSGRNARLVTIIFLAAQLGGCVIDVMSQQRTLMSFLCLGGLWGPLGVLGLALLLILSLSWIAGLLALTLPTLRPVYWSLVLLIPVVHAGQQLLVARGYLFCDGP